MAPIISRGHKIHNLKQSQPPTMTNQRRSYSFFVYRMIWNVMKYTPFMYIADLFLHSLYPEGSRYEHKPFGVLQNTDPDIISTEIWQILLYFIVIGSLRLIYYMLTFTVKSNIKNLRYESEKSQRNNDEKLVKSKMVSMANRLFPENTRIITGHNFNILCIGTSHISALSALLSSELISILRPNEVVLELDQERAVNMFNLNDSINCSGPNLVHDILDVKSYRNPVILKIRILSHLMNLYHSAGSEFRESARSAWSLDNGCKVVFGDLSIAETVKIMEETHSIWIILLFNALLIGMYYLLAAHSIEFVMDITDSLIHYGVGLVLGKLLVITVFCGAFHVFLKQWVQLLVSISPPRKCQESTVAHKMGTIAMADERDVELASNTVKTVREFSGEHIMVVTVVGLGHLQSVVDIAATILQKDGITVSKDRSREF